MGTEEQKDSKKKPKGDFYVITNQPGNKRKINLVSIYQSESTFNFNFMGGDATLLRLEDQVEVIDR